MISATFHVFYDKKKRNLQCGELHPFRNRTSVVNRSAVRLEIEFSGTFFVGFEGQTRQVYVV